MDVKLLTTVYMSLNLEMDKDGGKSSLDIVFPRTTKMFKHRFVSIWKAGILHILCFSNKKNTRKKMICWNRTTQHRQWISLNHDYNSNPSQAHPDPNVGSARGLGFVVVSPIDWFQRIELEQNVHHVGQTWPQAIDTMGLLAVYRLRKLRDHGPVSDCSNNWILCLFLILMVVGLEKKTSVTLVVDTSCLIVVQYLFNWKVTLQRWYLEGWCFNSAIVSGR